MGKCSGYVGWLSALLLIMSHLSSAVSDNPLILWWTDMGHTDRPTNCADVQCDITINRSRVAEHYSMAFIFDGTHFGEDGFPFPRKSGHIWGFFMNESPKNNDWLLNHEEVISLFNYTSTFRRESHVPFPLQWLEDVEQLTDVTYLLPTSEKSRLRREEGLAPIIFVHTDCTTPSGREDYMKMLQKYVQVDSYGACEHNKNFPNITGVKGMGEMMSPEFLHLIAQYKFAFSFENAVCPDYITEKLWRPLQAGVVPIVFGSPRVKDYLPSNKSAIVITDFTDIKAVADHITFLDGNEEEYEQYLQFKTNGIENEFLIESLKNRRGKGVNDGSIFTNFECFLCKKLHEAKYLSESGGHFDISQGEMTHYGCPEPHAFDEKGRYRLASKEPPDIHRKASYRARSIKYFHDRNFNASTHEIHKLAKEYSKICDEL